MVVGGGTVSHPFHKVGGVESVTGAVRHKRVLPG
jgi:hypothetical protein